jgi:hypothetical protein
MLLQQSLGELVRASDQVRQSLRPALSFWRSSIADISFPGTDDCTCEHCMQRAQIVAGLSPSHCKVISRSVEGLLRMNDATTWPTPS